MQLSPTDYNTAQRRTEQSSNKPTQAENGTLLPNPSQEEQSQQSTTQQGRD